MACNARIDERGKAWKCHRTPQTEFDNPQIPTKLHSSSPTSLTTITEIIVVSVGCLFAYRSESTSIVLHLARFVLSISF